MFNPLWKYAFGFSLFLSLMLGLALWEEKRHSHKLADRNAELSAKLESISTKRNGQKAETSERVKVVTRTIREADRKAEAVEKATLPGECRSPQEVLQADL